MPTYGCHPLDESTRILVKGDHVPRGHPEGKCVCYPESTFQEAAGLPTGELWPYEIHRDSPLAQPQLPGYPDLPPDGSMTRPRFCSDPKLD